MVDVVGLLLPRRSKRGRFVARERERGGQRIDTNDSFFSKRDTKISPQKKNKFGGPFVLVRTRGATDDTKIASIISIQSSSSSLSSSSLSSSSS